jgi:hypothetical protein
MQLSEIDNFCLARGPDILADGLNNAVGDKHLTIANGALIRRVNGGGFVQHRLRLLLWLRLKRGGGE